MGLAMPLVDDDTPGPDAIRIHFEGIPAVHRISQVELFAAVSAKLDTSQQWDPKEFPQSGQERD